MLAITLVSIALVATSFVPSAYANGEDEVRAMFNCINKVLVTGLPAAHIPSHDPLHVGKLFNLTFVVDNIAAKGVFKLENVYMWGITNATFTELVGNVDKESGWWNYTYSLLYPPVQLWGDWSLEATRPVNINKNGTFRINWTQYTLSGLWNMYWPLDNSETNLKEFKVAQEMDHIKAEVTGVNLLNRIVIEKVLENAVKTGLTSSSTTETLSKLLLKRLNDVWVGKSSRERIQTIIENC